MANRRMLHKNISISIQLSALSEFAQLLFTWMIPHLDDFGRINGDPKVIKALVVPMSNRSVADIEQAIVDLDDFMLIERYEVNGQKVIQFPTFDKYQTGLGKELKVSSLIRMGISQKMKKFLPQPKRT